jgi:hypothetical protein
MTWVAVGTAAAVGAGVGAGSQLIQGKSIDDALKGALIGGATGALTGGAGAALGGASGSAGASLSTEAASQIAPELVNTAAVNAVPFDTVVQQAVPEALGSAAANVAPAGIEQITPEMMNAVNLGSADAIAAQGTGTQVAGPAMNVAPTPPPPAGIEQIAPNAPAPTSMTPAELAQMTRAETGIVPNQPLISEPPGAMPDVSMGGSNLVSEPPTNPFMEGFASVKNFVKKNPLESAVIGYAGLSALDAFDSSEERKKKTYVNKYPISPNFQPSRPQPNVYQPRYAQGGITSFDDEAGVDQFAAGGSARKERDADADFKRYSSMMNARPEVEANEEALRKPRFARDDDADTRYQDALTAALTRQKKNNARASIGSPSIKRPTQLGTINLAPPGTQQAAAGGIMGYSLGGYAAGGNPRLLKGPGDGMSDDIPAVIGRKQPARLADGEFVVPADVVSHLGNGSTDAGAKKLHQMMDRIRTDRTGRKKQAPAVNADKYIPGKKKASGGIAGYAEGGITGYAEGGDIASLYTSILGREPDAAGLAAWQKALDTGTSFADIKKGFENSQEARTNTIKQIYNEQLGREAETEGLANWLNVYNSGQTADQISKSIAQAKEGQDLDKQSITSAYRQILGRNPEPEGQQFWLSVAQQEGLTVNQLKDRIAAAAVVEQKARNLEPGKKFTQMELDALGSDPYGGYYSEKSIYDIAPDAKNVSMIGDRQVQFTTPVTQQAVVSQFINGIYTAKQGLDMLNTPHAMAGLNVALANGSLSTKDYDNLVKQLDSSKTPAEVRAALASPKAQVIIDAAYGQQIAEATNLAEAQREAAQRQAVLNNVDPGYYLSNPILTQAYEAAGVSTPFQYKFYKDVDTRDRKDVMVTPENFLDKKNELVNAARANPYRVEYDPINRGIGNMPASVRDPYSDEGLAFLYGQMMDQYNTQTPTQLNPATQPYIGSTYKPPVPQRIQDETNAKAAYDAKVAADRAAYDKAPITRETFDATDYVNRYPDAGNRSIWTSGDIYGHYLEANRLGDVRTANRLPFTPTPYAPTPLIAAAPAPAPAPAVEAAAPVSNKAGGLLSIKHRRRA